MLDAHLTVGSCARLACTWEVLARKAGNVCPGREYPDLTVADFLVSAAAIAPILDRAPHTALGQTILHAIEATRRFVATNTNLGIVLLLAPLASVPLESPLRGGVADVLNRTTVADARDAYAAIRLANPGGLGAAKAEDVAAEPTLRLRHVMALAADHDDVAAQYRNGFHLVFETAANLARRVAAHGIVERAIVETQLDLMTARIDSLIARKLGASSATKVRDAAGAVARLGDLATPRVAQAYRDFDAMLRADGHARNPGTTADVIAAALFVALREQSITMETPFAWDGHPFGAT